MWWWSHIQLILAINGPMGPWSATADQDTGTFHFLMLRCMVGLVLLQHRPPRSSPRQVAPNQVLLPLSVCTCADHLPAGRVSYSILVVRLLQSVHSHVTDVCLSCLNDNG